MIAERRTYKADVFSELQKLALEQGGVQIVNQLKSWVRRQPRPGRAGRPDLFYAVVAMAYSSAITIDPNSPVMWLTRQADADRKTVENWIFQARQRGMLAETTSPRHRGGQVTDTAQKLVWATAVEAEKGEK